MELQHQLQGSHRAGLESGKFVTCIVGKKYAFKLIFVKEFLLLANTSANWDSNLWSSMELMLEGLKD